MRSIFSRDKQPGEKRDWLETVLKGRVLPILGIATVVVITVIIIRYRDSITELGALSYPGIFLGSMLWNATVLVPIPSFWIYSVLAPFLVCILPLSDWLAVVGLLLVS